jgi:hypothetical protein
MRTMEPSIWRATVKGTIVGFEHVGLHAGQAPLLGWRVREGVKQHVDAPTDEGVPVEFLHHITSNFKNNLQLLWAEEVGWSLVAILNWVQHWRLSPTIHRGEFLLNNASGAIHGHRCICSNNTGVGAIMGIQDRVEEGLWWNLNWFL